MRGCNVMTAVLAAVLFAAGPVPAQETWKPTRPITLIAPNAPGGTSDRTARELQRIIQKHQLIEVPLNVVNRPGGNGTIALNQLNSQSGDAHTLLIMTSAVISNHITGLTSYSYAEFSPVALLLGDNYGVNVRTGSTIRSARDMLDRVKKDPESVTFGVSSVGGTNHTSLVAALRKSGVDLRKTKIASFQGGGQISLQLLGGHVEAINTGLSNMADHLVQGKMRTLVISGPRRMRAPFADVPTWKEVGVDVTLLGWRGILAAKGITPAQVAYWDNVFRRLSQTEDWKTDLHNNYWVNIYAGAAETRRWLDAEQLETRQLLTELGMAKVQ
jgi:putative tricarboxylic transport membrane protein